MRTVRSRRPLSGIQPGFDRPDHLLLVTVTSGEARSRSKSGPTRIASDLVLSCSSTSYPTSGARLLGTVVRFFERGGEMAMHAIAARKKHLDLLP